MPHNVSASRGVSPKTHPVPSPRQNPIGKFSDRKVVKVPSTGVTRLMKAISRVPAKGLVGRIIKRVSPGWHNAYLNAQSPLLKLDPSTLTSTPDASSRLGKKVDAFLQRKVSQYNLSDLNHKAINPVHPPWFTMHL